MALSDDLAQHYRFEDGFYLIEIKLSSRRQLFNSLDPSPFFEKDLDEDAEAWIVSTVREFPASEPLKIRIYLPESEPDDLQEPLEQAIHNFFDYRIASTISELKESLKQGRVFLLVGLSVLLLSLVGSSFIAERYNGLWAELLSEGLIIGGWVAMWRPIEVFLYSWWPLLRRRRIYQRLTKIPVEVVTPAA